MPLVWDAADVPVLLLCEKPPPRCVFAGARLGEAGVFPWPRLGRGELAVQGVHMALMLLSLLILLAPST